jgi:hypothetical protein
MNTGWKDRKRNLEIQKPYAVFQYNKFTKCVDPADQYLSYYSALRKTVKWSKVSAKLCTLQCIFVYKTLNTNKQVKYKNFLHEVARSWISEVQNSSPVLMNCNSQRSNQHQGSLNRVPPGRLTRDFSKHTLDKIAAGGEGKKKYPTRHCKVHAGHNNRSETSYICKFCIVPLHKVFILRNTTQFGTTRLSICSFFCTRFRNIIYTVKL